MSYIYILKLKNSKYYIGRTNNPNLRIQNHESGSGSAWTNKYPVKKIIKIISNCHKFDEDKYTKIYMQKYGIENVRGGSYCSVVLSDSMIETLQHEINGATDCCYKCSEPDHFANNCPYDRCGPIDIDCEYCNKSLQLIKDKLNPLKRELFCINCNIKFTTDEIDHYNKTIESSQKTSSAQKQKTTSTQKQKTTEIERCAGILFGGQKNYKKALDTLTDSYRCQRYGHDEENCYATNDVYDSKLPNFNSMKSTIWCCNYCHKEFKNKRDAEYHEQNNCKAVQYYDTDDSDYLYDSDTSIDDIICYRCNRPGHYANQCYVKF